MASDIHLKLDGIVGESKDAEHRGEIEIESFTWLIESDVGFSGGSGGSGKVAPQALSLRHHIDLASARLLAACSTGQRIRGARLSVRAGGQQRGDYLVITLTDVQVKSVGLSVQDPGAQPPMALEDFSLVFAKIKYEYKATRPDGSFGATSTYSFNFRTNSPSLAKKTPLEAGKNPRTR